eukprot:9478439-Pyramimonas_sp.AAC.1
MRTVGRQHGGAARATARLIRGRGRVPASRWWPSSGRRKYEVLLGVGGDIPPAAGEKAIDIKTQRMYKNEAAL